MHSHTHTSPWCSVCVSGQQIGKSDVSKHTHAHTNTTRLLVVSFCLVTTQLIAVSLALTAKKKNFVVGIYYRAKILQSPPTIFLIFLLASCTSFALIFTMSFSREKLSTEPRKIPSKNFVFWFTYGCAIYCWQPSWKKGNFLWRLFSSCDFLAQHPLKSLLFPIKHFSSSHTFR